MIIWKDASKLTPNFDNIKYLTIVKVNNYYSYSFSYWNGIEWHAEYGEVVLFTETDPKDIVDNFNLKD